MGETLRLRARAARQDIVASNTIKENEPLFVPNCGAGFDTQDEPLYALGSRCNSPVLKGKGKKKVDFSVFSQGVEGGRKYPVAFDLLNKPKQNIPDTFWDLPNMNRKTGNLKKNKCSALPVMTKEECCKIRFGSEKIVYELPVGAHLPTAQELHFMSKKKGKRHQKRKEVRPMPDSLFDRAVRV